MGHSVVAFIDGKTNTYVCPNNKQPCIHVFTLWKSSF